MFGIQEKSIPQTGKGRGERERHTDRGRKGEMNRGSGRMLASVFWHFELLFEMKILCLGDYGGLAGLQETNSLQSTSNIASTVIICVCLGLFVCECVCVYVHVNSLPPSETANFIVLLKKNTHARPLKLSY